MDVTLGSLWGESLGILEEMGWLGDESSEEDEEEERGLARASSSTAGAVRNRGMPYFEEMVENSRLGRVKRRKGGQTSADGSSSVEWEVTEVDGGGDDDAVMQESVAETVSAGGNKRIKIGH